MSILNLFAELVKQSGISIIYITHDLSTAYYLGAQTGGEIIIMYRGSIIEQGLVEKVLTEPVHPYTKMLMEALPELDTQKRWKDKVKLPSLEWEEFQASGCKFAGRCPQVMERCKGETPKDISVDDVLVKCFLYS
ncbi:Dipeptide transport ATP-binding protein DppD [subsurface metagenome]